MYREVYSEFALEAMSIRFDGEETAVSANCVGSCEETLEVKLITKKCRGSVERYKVKPTGNGSLKISMHIPYEVYLKMFGMDDDATLDAGVHAYGKMSKHPEFSIAQMVKDEDDEVKYKAYPRCVIQNGISRKIENGAEEVAEIELEISLMPDTYGNAMYEALDKEMTPGAGSRWMTQFDPTIAHTSPLG